MRRVPRIPRICAYEPCSQPFAIKASVLNRPTRGRFCSSACSRQALAEQNTAPLAERFWAKVAIAGPDDCWLWQGGCYPNGYGKLWVKERQQSVGAHIVSWVLAHEGEWPDPGINVCHTCDNPPCVNSAHLWLGTQKDNLADAGSKGHMAHPEDRPRGENHALSVLTDAQWAEAWELYTTGEWSHRAIAARYGVSREVITNRLRAHRKALGIPTPITRVRHNSPK